MFWRKFIEVFAQEKIILFIFLGAFGFMLIATCVAYALKTTSIYSACSAVSDGAVLLWSIFSGAHKQAKLTLIAAILIFEGILYLLLFSALRVQSIVIERKRRRREIERRLCYSLPNRDNSYVRTRLNTTLQVEQNSMNADMGGVEGLKKPIKLEYARQLLKRVKASPITKAELLQLEEMEKAFALYMYKEHWTAGDLRAINELCAALLKLSAKYSV